MNRPTMNEGLQFWRKQAYLVAVFLLIVREYQTTAAAYRVRQGRVATVGENVTFEYSKVQNGNSLSWNFRTAQTGELKKVYNGRKLDPSSGLNYTVTENENNMVAVVKFVGYFNAGRYEFSDVDFGRTEIQDLNILGSEIVCSKFDQEYQRGEYSFKRESALCEMSYAGNLLISLRWAPITAMTSKITRTPQETDTYTLINLKSYLDRAQRVEEPSKPEEFETYSCYAAVEYFQNYSSGESEINTHVMTKNCSVQLSNLEHRLNSNIDLTKTTSPDADSARGTTHPVISDPFQNNYSTMNSLSYITPAAQDDAGSVGSESTAKLSPMIIAFIAVIAVLVLALSVSVYCIVKRRAKKGTAPIQTGAYEGINKNYHNYQGLTICQERPNSSSCNIGEYDYPERNIYECPYNIEKQVRLESVEEETPKDSTRQVQPPLLPQRPPFRNGAQIAQPEYEMAGDMLQKNKIPVDSSENGGISIFNSGYLTMPQSSKPSSGAAPEYSFPHKNTAENRDRGCEHEDDERHQSIRNDCESISNSSVSDGYLNPMILK